MGFASEPTEMMGEVRMRRVEGTYSSQAGCEADGPHVVLAHNDHLYAHCYCRFGPDGFWHVWLSN
jgi:hypothetical protein